METLHAGLLEEAGQNLRNLPPKVLQFGTGVLLRGLPDYYIDKANRAGVFNGRIVVVKSTQSGSTDAFEQQDGLYTHWLRGVSNGQTIDEHYVNASVYAVHNATEDWELILKYAEMPSMELVISNTTEAGIRLEEDQVHAAPPRTYPGKLLSFLYHRYHYFSGDPNRGMIIVPTELIPQNGQLLMSVVIELAHQHGFDSGFIDWLENANEFCNSLVDRIVPGAVAPPTVPSLGYEDSLMIMSEPYGLWAIETDSDRARQLLTFSQVDEGVVLTPDIDRYLERKLRLLNGVHTFSCGIALLAKHTFVLESMQAEWMVAYMTQLMQLDIAPLLRDAQISQEEANLFSQQVLDRFRNPFLKHAWKSIAAQFTAKMNMRNAKLMHRSIETTGQLPATMAIGFAAYFLALPQLAAVYPDDAGVRYWNDKGESCLEDLMQDPNLWGEGLAGNANWITAVSEAVAQIQSKGIVEVVKTASAQLTIV